jgi:hypothetical protein
VLKKHTSLKPRDKIEQLKQVGSAIDAKTMPILDQQQQQKFKAMREQMRRDMIEKMGSRAVQKAEAKIRQEI